VQCKRIYWDQYTLEQLQHISSCIGGHVLSNLCRYLAQDFKTLGSGWPDLLLWKDGAAKFVEVKGPRDRLSDKQRVWAHLINAAGSKIEVCHIVEGSTKEKCQDGDLFLLLENVISSEDTTLLVAGAP